MAHRVRNVKMRKRAKFRGKRPEHDRDIAFFSNFKMAAVRHIGFLKVQNFSGRQGYEGEHSSSCKISWQSVKPLPRYGNFSIIQDGGRPHLGFLNF